MHRIYAAGIFVNAGFILGFDTEKAAVGDAMADFIDEAAIPMAMVGLLYACPNTQLTRRLEKEGRLHSNNGVMEQEAGDQCTLGCNFETLRPMREVLLDYRRVLEKVYSPEAYARRLKRLTDMLDRSGRPKELAHGDYRQCAQPVRNRAPHHQCRAGSARSRCGTRSSMPRRKIRRRSSIS